MPNERSNRNPCRTESYIRELTVLKLVGQTGCGDVESQAGFVARRKDRAPGSAAEIFAYSRKKRRSRGRYNDIQVWRSNGD